MSENTDLRARLERATEIEDQQVELLGGGEAYVESQSGDGWYLVSLAGEPSCECPDHVYRGTTCKHLAALADRLEILDLG